MIIFRPRNIFPYFFIVFSPHLPLRSLLQLSGSRLSPPVCGLPGAGVREIDRNFRNRLTLSYFEDKYHLSRFHIAREFKKYMGITLNEYLINARISYAKELLKYTDLQIGEIAFEAGMNNVTHFINLFKSREEMTPLSYRKAWKG